jgi:hypothetical protein
MTAGGNRQRPSYETIVGWLDQCHTQISAKPEMISRSFYTTGLWHTQFRFSSFIDFVAALNGRLKEILFVTDINSFDRTCKLFKILTFNFSSVQEFTDEINAYVRQYHLTSLEFFKHRAISRSVPATTDFDPIVEFNSSPAVLGNVINIVDPVVLNGLVMGQNGLVLGQNGLVMGQNGLVLGQNGLGMGQNGLGMGHNGLDMGHNGLGHSQSQSLADENIRQSSVSYSNFSVESFLNN